ncbi:MAG: hypothetical protein P1U40_12300 [Coxiellaceae bacterium]|nr:hypothetical protein [Coxiellaceae bacterium]
MRILNTEGDIGQRFAEPSKRDIRGELVAIHHFFTLIARYDSGVDHDEAQHNPVVIDETTRVYLSDEAIISGEHVNRLRYIARECTDVILTKQDRILAHELRHTPAVNHSSSESNENLLQWLILAITNALQNGQSTQYSGSLEKMYRHLPIFYGHAAFDFDHANTQTTQLKHILKLFNADEWRDLKLLYSTVRFAHLDAINLTLPAAGTTLTSSTIQKAIIKLKYHLQQLSDHGRGATFFGNPTAKSCYQAMIRCLLSQYMVMGQQCLEQETFSTVFTRESMQTLNSRRMSTWSAPPLTDQMVDQLTLLNATTIEVFAGTRAYAGTDTDMRTSDPKSITKPTSLKQIHNKFQSGDAVDIASSPRIHIDGRLLNKKQKALLQQAYRDSASCFHDETPSYALARIQLFNLRLMSIMQMGQLINIKKLSVTNLMQWVDLDACPPDSGHAFSPKHVKAVLNKLSLVIKNTKILFAALRFSHLENINVPLPANGQVINITDIHSSLILLKKKLEEITSLHTTIHHQEWPRSLDRNSTSYYREHIYPKMVRNLNTQRKSADFVLQGAQHLFSQYMLLAHQCLDDKKTEAAFTLSTMNHLIVTTPTQWVEPILINTTLLRLEERIASLGATPAEPLPSPTAPPYRPELKPTPGRCSSVDAMTHHRWQLSIVTRAVDEDPQPHSNITPR